MIKQFVIVLILCLVSAGCATTGKQDPLQSYNRHAYHFNKAFDNVVLKPAATIYRGITPWPVRKGVSNFFGNLGEITTFANDLLQLNFKAAASTLWRFGINSTLGLGGLFDVADRAGVERDPQDFGMTFAKWGYKHSSYLVLPFFGPSTVRDALGIVPDFLVSPYPNLDPAIRASLIGGNIINQRSNLLDVQGVVDQASLDPYIFQRNAYLQNRKARISGEANNDNDPFVEEGNDGATPSLNVPQKKSAR